jgi:hypothetical protein
MQHIVACRQPNGPKFIGPMRAKVFPGYQTRPNFDWKRVKIVKFRFENSEDCLSGIFLQMQALDGPLTIASNANYVIILQNVFAAN